MKLWKLPLTALLGISADIANLIFGSNNSIVSRMSCIVLKCVTQLLQEHQARASFRSHASKTLSRNIDQLVRDIYNYFSKLAKQTNEFKEFQDFTDIPKHQILKFITFTGCHWGYLWGELWKNGHLSLFFQGQYLINRIQVSEKIAVELGCIFNMFYFTDCVPNITDNLNTVFQSSNPTIHSVCADYIPVYMSLLSCFMKRQFLRCTGEWVCHLDPSETSSHVELKQMCVGLNAAKIMAKPAFKNKPPTAKLKDLKRSKNFVVALVEEPQKWLRINQLMKDLKMLNPRVAISEDITTLTPIVTKLPNIIPVNLHQDLDAQ